MEVAAENSQMTEQNCAKQPNDFRSNDRTRQFRVAFATQPPECA